MVDNQRFLSDALEQLKPYLLSDEIFWNLGKDPQLTLGNLLLAAASLRAVGSLQAADQGAIAGFKKEWGSAWEKKAEKEFAARLRLWSAYLAELGESPSRHAGSYATEVRHRVLLQLLAGEASGLGRQLAGVDGSLKSLTAPAAFVWDTALEPAFPKSDYWFLRVKPKAR
jgi:hypothetical protein